MAGNSQLTFFNMRDIDRSIEMDRLYRDLLERSRAPLTPRTAEDDAFDAWAARQGAAEAKVSLDEFGGTTPSYGGDGDLFNAGTASLLGSLASGYFGSRAANRATGAQLAASQAAIDERRRRFDQTRADLAPYVPRSHAPRNQLAVMMGLNPDMPSYGNRDPKQDPMWGGYRTMPRYAPGTVYQPTQGGFATQHPPQQNNPSMWTNAISSVLANMKR